MCGICGLVVGRRFQLEGGVLSSMRDVLVHRGPDDSGQWVSPDLRAGLGHQRLSIVDLSTGHQPMSNEDGNVWLVFNGEIYNHADLRSDLEARGHRYKTRSDSESILHAYEEFGSACLDRLRGEFAFAIWDGGRKRLLAARDRMGVKPFYFASRPGLFVFGSEIKSLLAHPDVARRLNAPFIAHYLAFNACVAPSTPFEGIEKLPAAHALTVEENGAIATWRYWYPAPGFSSRPREEEAHGEIYRLFRAATQDRMTSDVPFGVFLSGGWASCRASPSAWGWPTTAPSWPSTRGATPT